jgi:hypothetical protein
VKKRVVVLDCIFWGGGANNLLKHSLLLDTNYLPFIPSLILHTQKNTEKRRVIYDVGWKHIDIGIREG